MGREIRSKQDVTFQGPSNPSISDYKDRLVKLIPSEIITAYITIKGLLENSSKNPVNSNLILYIVIAFLLVVLPFYLVYFSKVSKFLQVFLTSLGFLIWVLAVGSPIKSILEYDSTLVGSIFLILYTLIIPKIYKG